MFATYKRTISIAGIDKKALLAALFNASKAPGDSFYAKGFNTVMTEEKALAHINEKRASGRLYFDYLDGRYMKVDISGDELDPSLYDSVNGAGAASAVIQKLRSGAAVEFKEDYNATLRSQMAELENPEYDRQQWNNAFKGPDF